MRIFSSVFMARQKIIAVSPVTVFLVLSLGIMGCNPSFRSDISKNVHRLWIGPEYWANRLQDWQVANGRIECIESNPAKPMRTVHLLPYSLGSKAGKLKMKVRTGVLTKTFGLTENTWTGFLIGAGQGALDYRGAALVHHDPGKGGGIIAAVNGKGEAVFRDMTREGYPVILSENLSGNSKALNGNQEVDLDLKAIPKGDKYEISLSVSDVKTGKRMNHIILKEVDPDLLTGNIALVSHPGSKDDSARYWFRNWEVAGSKLVRNEEGTFGPVMAVYFTLHEKVLKMATQFPILGEADPTNTCLEIWDQSAKNWKQVAEALITPPSYTALFRVENWNSTVDIPYRVVYSYSGIKRKSGDFYFEGTVPHDPAEKNVVSVAAFTGNQNVAHHADGERKRDAGQNSFDVGVSALDSRWTNNNIWFPHEEMVSNVKKQNVDLLVFTGDQIYESNPSRAGFDNPFPDYLYKWYLWCWAYRDLTRNIPAVCFPDDHDVYQGNLWGWGGRRTDCDYPSESFWSPYYNNGGYWMPVEWVKMVERTQTCHLPDPYDPTPVEQGIGVYYTELNCGGISFAILEDRKFKIPSPQFKDRIKQKEDSLRSVYGQDFTSRVKDIPEAKILGKRQLNFIRNWAGNWTGDVIKVALSQTIFAAAHTSGFGPGKPALDHDSNGWPAPARNTVLEELRKGFVFMIGGDQHLATVIHHGIDEFNDAGYSFCVPSVANFWTRFWLPESPGQNHIPGIPNYTGEYFDAFGNRLTMLAVANPKSPDDLTEEEIKRGRTELYRKAPGYGVVRFDKESREITIECWPRYTDPDDPATGTQYPGWPVTIAVEDNFGKKARSFIPTLKFIGMIDPVVQVIDEGNKKIVYTVRSNGSSFRGKVFKSGVYTIKVGEPGTDWIKILENIQSVDEKSVDTLTLNFGSEKN